MISVSINWKNMIDFDILMSGLYYRHILELHLLGDMNYFFPNSTDSKSLRFRARFFCASRIVHRRLMEYHNDGLNYLSYKKDRVGDDTTLLKKNDPTKKTTYRSISNIEFHLKSDQTRRNTQSNILL